MRRQQSFATVVIGKSVLIREGIARILRAANFPTLTSVSCVDELPPNSPPQSLLVLIVSTGNDFAVVIEQIELLHDRHPRARTAIVATHYRVDEMVSALRAGANGYFADAMTCDVFIKSIELVMMGETVFPPASIMSFALESGNNDPGKSTEPHNGSDHTILTTDDKTTQLLSPRERSILQCLIGGDSNKSIARKIDIAEATVKVHVKAILRKIRVQNRTQAAIWAMNHGSVAARAASGAPPTATADIRKLSRDGPLYQADQDISPIDAPLTTRVEVRRISRLARRG